MFFVIIYTATIEPPIINVIISDVNQQNLTFTFTPSSTLQNCPAVHYSIASDNCGHCPNITASNSFICSLDVPLETRECTVAIETLLCDSISGTANASTSFSFPGYFLKLCLTSRYFKAIMLLH